MMSFGKVWVAFRRVQYPALFQSKPNALVLCHIRKNCFNALEDALKP
jgi:hypothetical protein